MPTRSGCSYVPSFRILNLSEQPFPSPHVHTALMKKLLTIRTLVERLFWLRRNENDLYNPYQLIISTWTCLRDRANGAHVIGNLGPLTQKVTGGEDFDSLIWNAVYTCVMVNIR